MITTSAESGEFSCLDIFADVENQFGRNLRKILLLVWRAISVCISFKFPSPKNLSEPRRIMLNVFVRRVIRSLVRYQSMAIHDKQQSLQIHTSIIMCQANSIDCGIIANALIIYMLHIIA